MFRCDSPAGARRSARDRRSGTDRRVVDLWRQLGRPGFDLRTGADRRSGRECRHDEPVAGAGPGGPWRPEVVMPWQIIEEPAGPAGE